MILIPVVTLNEEQKRSIRRLFGSFQRGDLQPRGHHRQFVADYRRHLDANAGRTSHFDDVDDSNAKTMLEEDLNNRLSGKLDSMISNPEFVNMLSFRKKLPAFDMKSELVL